MKYIVPIFLLTTGAFIDRLPSLTKFFFYCALAVYLFEVLRFFKLIWWDYMSPSAALKYIGEIYNGH